MICKFLRHLQHASDFIFLALLISTTIVLYQSEKSKLQTVLIAKLFRVNIYATVYEGEFQRQVLSYGNKLQILRHKF